MLFAKKSFEASPAAMLARLRQMAVECPRPALQQARTWLVFAGQIEQGERDAGGADEVQEVADRAAELLLATRRGETVATAHRHFVEALGRARVSEGPVEVRIPEGFAWYALFPDSYAGAAERWSAARWRGEEVLVIGLRSIGTALSAVVAAALAGRGIAARRMTLRPEGHPFHRQASLPREAATGATAIIVDEGPGLSGSSMAGTAEALAKSGVAEESIVFFPGHEGGPGAMADGSVRGWWRPERCWTGKPPALPVSGTPGVHWLFGGFAAVNEKLETLAEVKRERQLHLAGKGLACPCPAFADGWLGLDAEGEALAQDALSQRLVQDMLGPYIVAAARPSDEAATTAAIGRIAAAIDAPQELAQRVRAACRGLPLAGDGRLAPGEWLRRPDGRMLKRDATGTDCDHSWAGAQSILWDMAGALAEWQMPEGMRSLLLRQLAEHHGIAADPLALAFHEAGYCALALARAEHDGNAEAARRFAALGRSARERMQALR